MLVEGEDLCCFQQQDISIIHHHHQQPLIDDNLDHYMDSGAGRMSYGHLPTAASTHLTHSMNRDLTHYPGHHDYSRMSCGKGLIDMRGASCSRAINFFDHGQEM
jgi:hypothetical protein